MPSRIWFRGGTMADEFVARPYQEYAIRQIIEKPALALMLDMGLGKTVTTLTAMQLLKYDYFDVSTVLVIAPLRVAESTWTAECECWEHLKGFHGSRILGSAGERLKALKKKADFYIINRENVPWLVELYGRKWPFDMVVIDESSSFKNPSAKRFKALRKVRPYMKRIVELTGTPAPNGLLNLWSQMYLLDKGERLGTSLTAYKRKYFTPGASNGYVVYEWKLAKDSAKDIYAKISDICVSMKSEDYLTLPPVIYNQVPVLLTPAQMNTYKEMEKQYVVELAGEELVAASAAAVSNKLVQLANGSAYTENGEVVRFHKAKVEALADIAESNAGCNMLVFYWYKHDLAALQDKFPQAVVLKNAEDIDRWNKGEIQMLLAHPASAGHGLNLQRGGHMVVWFSLTWSLEFYQQANKRLHRSGQTETVIIHHLITAGTIDEDIMKALEGKAAGQNSMLEAVKARIRRYADNEAHKG